MIANLLENVGLMLDRVRRVGHTTALAELAKARGWRLVCMDAREANQVRKRYGVETLSLDELEHNVQRGHDSGVIFDASAVDRLCRRVNASMAAQQCKIEEGNNEIRRLQARIYQLERYQDAVEAALA